MTFAYDGLINITFIDSKTDIPYSLRFEKGGSICDSLLIKYAEHLFGVNNTTRYRATIYPKFYVSKDGKVQDYILIEVKLFDKESEEPEGLRVYWYAVCYGILFDISLSGENIDENTVTAKKAFDPDGLLLRDTNSFSVYDFIKNIIPPNMSLNDIKNTKFIICKDPHATNETVLRLVDSIDIS